MTADFVSTFETWWRNILIIFAGAISYPLISSYLKDRNRILSISSRALILTTVPVLIWLNSVQHFIHNDSANIELFKPYLHNYLDICSSISDVGNHQEEINGPIIIVDLDSNSIHSIFQRIPAALAAKTPKEVEIIVFIKSRIEEKLLYNLTIDNKPIRGYSLIWDVDIVRVNPNETIFRRTYTARPPEIGIYGTSRFDKLYKVIYEGDVPGIVPRGLWNEDDLYEDIFRLSDYSVYSPIPYSWKR